MKYKISHILSLEDVCHLSDSQSEILIKKGSLKVGQLIKVEARNGQFLCEIIDIGKSSIELVVIEKTAHLVGSTVEITLIQSVSHDYKFNFFLEKAVEIGVTEIIPVHSEYSTLTLKAASKKANLWKNIIEKSTEQSRNPSPPIVQPVQTLSKVKIENNGALKLCLSTEPQEMKLLNKIDLKHNSKKFIVAVGPETGWSFTDLQFFRKNKFSFVALQGNILRTETAALVTSSIIKFVNEEL